jgi:hypothetical protein
MVHEPKINVARVCVSASEVWYLLCGCACCYYAIATCSNMYISVDQMVWFSHLVVERCWFSLVHFLLPAVVHLLACISDLVVIHRS